MISQAYTQGLTARWKSVREQPPKTWAKLVAANTDPPMPLAPDLSTSYGKFLRSDQVYLLTQSEQNLSILYRNLIGIDTVDRTHFTSAFDALVEHGTRRSWLLYCIASSSDEQYSIDLYNQLVDSLSHSTERRISTVRILRPPFGTVPERRE